MLAKPELLLPPLHAPFIIPPFFMGTILDGDPLDALHVGDLGVDGTRRRLIGGAEVHIMGDSGGEASWVLPPSSQLLPTMPTADTVAWLKRTAHGVSAPPLSSAVATATSVGRKGTS